MIRVFDLMKGEMWILCDEKWKKKIAEFCLPYVWVFSSISRLNNVTMTFLSNWWYILWSNVFDYQARHCSYEMVILHFMDNNQSNRSIDTRIWWQHAFYGSYQHVHVINNQIETEKKFSLRPFKCFLTIRKLLSDNEVHSLKNNIFFTKITLIWISRSSFWVNN